MPRCSPFPAPTVFSFSFSDTNGFADMGVENILIGPSLDGRHACYLAFSQPANVLFLVNDNGDALLPGKSLGASGTLANSQCTVSWPANPATASGNNIRLDLNISFSAGFGPSLIVFLAARDVNESNNTDWHAMGTVALQ